MPDTDLDLGVVNGAGPSPKRWFPPSRLVALISDLVVWARCLCPSWRDSKSTTTAKIGPECKGVHLYNSQLSTPSSVTLTVCPPLMPLPHSIPPSPSHPPSSKTLTPQRKHRKLLKDGSGAEVWPESIEKIFVQGSFSSGSCIPPPLHFSSFSSGLREYWNSPYATYPQSRGRSRWRNQFLVDYLQKHNITRSKKQVASHIQVLRNMWKGEPGKSPLQRSPPN